MAASPGAILLALTPKRSSPILVCPMIASALLAFVNSLKRDGCKQDNDQGHVPVAIWDVHFFIARGLLMCHLSNLIRSR